MFTWKKSTRSFSDGCVEVAHDEPGVVRVRDTKDGGTGPVLTFTEVEWTKFLEGAKDNEFDIDA